MANYFPLIVNAVSANIEELPAGSNLNLSLSGITNADFVNTANANISNLANIGNLTVTGDATLASVLTANLRVNTSANLGNVGNITILGGTNGQSLVTDGNGVLTWASATASNANYANFANVANIANTANSVAVANVVGIGNIATINLTGNASRVLYANGAFAPITTAANANFANFAGNATISNSANVAAVALSVSLSNVIGAGNVAALNLDGNASNILFGNGVFAEAPVGYSNANVANYLPTYTGLVGGTLSTNAQPNITRVGSLTGLTVSNATGVVNFITTANVSLGAVSNLRITGGIPGQYLQTDGAGNLSFSTIVTNGITNGTSNVNIPDPNGNVNTSVGGNANVLVVTGTGANVTGTLNVTGNANTGNLGATRVVATTLGGSLTTNAQPNITSVGNLTGLTVNGVSNLGPVANVIITGGSNNQLLTTDGTGVLSWKDPAVAAKIANGTSYANIPAQDGNLVVGVNSNTWTFGTDGNLTVANSVVLPGSAALQKISSTGVRLSANTTANTSAITVDSNGNISAYAGNSITINANNSGAWAFAASGNLDAAGNINYAGLGQANITGFRNVVATANVEGTGIVVDTTVGSRSTTISANNAQTSNLSIVLPPNAGSSGQFLSTDGVGNTSWKTAVTNAAGNTTEIQFNNNGNFSASANLSWDNANSNLFVGGKTTYANGTTVQDVNATNFDITVPSQATIRTAAGTRQFTFANDGSLGVPKDALINGNVAITVGTDTANITAGNITGLSNILQLGGANGVQVQSGRLVSSDGNIALYINEGQIVKGVAEVQVGAGNPNSALKLFGTTPANTTANISIYPGSNLDSSYSLVLPANTGSNGQFLQTDGNGNLTFATVDTSIIKNGTSNVSIPVADGNVNTSVGGNANILVVTGTGANITGTLNATGNANVGNIGATEGVLTGNLSVTGNANVGNIGATNGVLTGNLNVTGNANVGNIGSNNGVLTGTLSVTGNSNVGNLGTVGLITATGNITGGNLTTGGVLSVTGNANVGNLGTSGLITATGNVTGGNLVTAGEANVGNLVVSGKSNLNAIGNITVTGGSNGQVIQTDGNGNLTFTTIDTWRIQNGTSNVQVLPVNGNVTVTVNGNANIATFTDTGVNVAGTLNATGNANVGNIGATDGVLTGNLSVTGNANVGNLGTAGQVIANGNITGGNLITGGIANVTGNANVGNLGTGGLIIATGNITGGNIITGGVVNATGNITTTSNVVATANVIANNLNANTWFNGNSNIRIVNNDGIYISSNGQSNVIGISSNGTHAFTLVSNDMTITGNLNVQGTATYINTQNQSVSDPIIDLGVGQNNTPLTSNDGKDRGIAMHTYGVGGTYTTSGPTQSGNTVIALTSTAGIVVGMEIGDPADSTIIPHGTTVTQVNGGNITISTPTTKSIQNGVTLNIGLDNIRFIGWDVANSAFKMSSNTSIDGNNNVTFNELGNVIAALYIGNTEGNTGNYANDVFVGGNVDTSRVQNGNSNVTITANGNVAISSAGNANVVIVTDTGANITGTLNATGNANVGNIGAADGVYTANVTAGNIYANAGTIGANLLTGTLTTNAQPNITSVGNLLNLTSNGNVDFTGASNVLLGNIANIHIPGGSNGQAVTTDGNGNLSWLSVTGGSFKTDTVVATAGQTSFSATYAPTGSVTMSINGATIPSAAVTSSGSAVTYVPAQNQSYVLKAGDVVTFGYMYGGGTTTSLANLSDVNIASPVTGQALVYNGTQNKWVAETLSAINSGTSNVSIPSANGNVNISAAGNANVVVVTGTGANVTGTLNVTGNTLINGNLTVQGTTTTVDTASLNVTDPIISLGGGANGAPLTTNDGKDRGTLLQYYTTQPVSAFMGWDNSASEFSFGSNVANVSGVITFNNYGNVRASEFLGNVSGTTVTATGNVTGNFFIGNGSLLTGLSTSSISNGNSNVTVIANGNVTISSAGNANVLTVTGTGANVAGTLTATGNVTGNFFIGNGSQLTGISSNGLANGTSDIAIPVADGNILFDVGGIANALVITTDANSRLRTNGEVYIGSNSNRGGANFAGVMTWENTSSGATNGKKFWRINPTGNLELVNNAYSAVVLSIADTGNVDIAGRVNVGGALSVASTANITGSLTVSSNANVTGSLNVTSSSLFTGNMVFGNMTGTFASINTANIPTLNTNVIRGQTPYAGAKTAFNAAIDTEITVDAFRFRMSNQGGIFPQVISNTLATLNIGWVCVAAYSGFAIDQRGSTGTIIANNAWTSLYTFRGMDNSSDVNVVTLQNKTNQTAYRVTFLRTDTGTTTGYCIIAERLW